MSLKLMVLPFVSEMTISLILQVFQIYVGLRLVDTVVVAATAAVVVVDVEVD